LTDMVRSTHYMHIIEEEFLVENAAKVGAYFLDQLRDLQRYEPTISAVRGRGLLLAFDLPDADTREKFWKSLFDLGVLTLRSGDRSIRFRPALDITTEVVDEAIGLIRQYCRKRKERCNRSSRKSREARKKPVFSRVIGSAAEGAEKLTQSRRSV